MDSLHDAYSYSRDYETLFEDLDKDDPYSSSNTSQNAYNKSPPETIRDNVLPGTTIVSIKNIRYNKIENNALPEAFLFLCWDAIHKLFEFLSLLSPRTPSFGARKAV